MLRFDFVAAPALAALVTALVSVESVAATPVPVETVAVVSHVIEREVKLPGELKPYLSVPLRARVAGYVERVNVDRGSTVKQGDVLIVLSAPEMAAQLAEAQAKVQALKLQKSEAEARAAGAEDVAQRAVAANAGMAGVIPEQQVVGARKNAEAARASAQAFTAFTASIRAAENAVAALRDLTQYLTIRAPFSGVVTERDVHPGALGGPGASTEAQ